MKKVLIIITCLALLVGLAGCGLSNHLEDGRYEITSITIGGAEVNQAHELRAFLRPHVIYIDGNEFVQHPPWAETPTSGRWRVRNGFWEIRVDNVTGSRFGREDGSATADFISTTVVDGTIVWAHLLHSLWASYFGAEVIITFSLTLDDDPISLEQLIGRWDLIVQTLNGGVLNSNTSELWTGGYFIQFNEDKTFLEMEFWTEGMLTSRGIFTLMGDDSLLLTPLADYGLYDFVSQRNIRLIDENTLLITYSRFIAQYDMYFFYMDTFVRSNEPFDTPVVILVTYEFQVGTDWYHDGMRMAWVRFNFIQNQLFANLSENPNFNADFHITLYEVFSPTEAIQRERHTLVTEALFDNLPTGLEFYIVFEFINLSTGLAQRVQTQNFTT